jgi:cell wall-associated NlpC family hydrolase
LTSFDSDDKIAEHVAKATQGGFLLKPKRVFTALVASLLMLLGAASVASAQTAGADAIAIGEGSLGAPYAINGPYGTFDCSGFTSYVYEQFGVYLPDSPGAQYAYGIPVYGELYPGDLVFFAEGGYGITHVGIYAGSGLVLHASSYAGSVTYTPLAVIPGYVGARRI